MTTSARLLALLSLLQARRDWPGMLLARRLEVSPRTVRRDVDRLRELGYPIAAVKGPDGGYRLDAGTELPPLLFDDDQAVALSVALRLATTSGAGIEEAAARALVTVRQVMPARLRRRIDTLEVSAVRRPSIRPDAQVDSAVLGTVGAAIHAHEVLRFDYDAPASAAVPSPHSPHGSATTPVVRRGQPHHLVTWGGRWYLVAWDLDRADWRLFRVDRITPRIPTGPRFTPREVPGGDVDAFVRGKFRGSDGASDSPHADEDAGSGDWPCRGTVILDLPAAVVLTYTRDGLVEGLGPNRCRLRVGSWSWTALAAELGRFDADFHVVGPAELGAACRRLADRYARTASRPGGSS